MDAQVSINNAAAFNEKMNDITQCQSDITDCETSIAFIKQNIYEKTVFGTCVKTLGPIGLIVLFTLQEVATMLGLNSVQAEKVSISVVNGDWDSNSTCFDCVFFLREGAQFYLLCHGGTQGGETRVNYRISYPIELD